jgi:LPS-assembly protein
MDNFHSTNPLRGHPCTPLLADAAGQVGTGVGGRRGPRRRGAGADANATQTQTQAPAGAASAADSPPAPPIVLRARELRARPDLDVIAEGDAELSRGGLSIRADRLSYDVAEDLAAARGDVRIRQDGARFAGPELQLRLERFEGFFLAPVFHFDTLGTSGSAERVDFLGGRRLSATRADYTSCPREDPEGPQWVLEADRVTLDLDRNEGFAEGARAALPGRADPGACRAELSAQRPDRKSGWLPPSVDITTAAASSSRCRTTGTSRRTATPPSRRA